MALGFTADEVGEAVTLVSRHESLGIGLADASIVILADRYDTNRGADARRASFRALRTRSGGPFTLLPADG